jgi:hypothetical protein
MSDFVEFGVITQSEIVNGIDMPVLGAKGGGLENCALRAGSIAVVREAPSGALIIETNGGKWYCVTNITYAQFKTAYIDP